MPSESLDLFRSAGLDEVDPDIAALLGRELERQRGTIELIASENFTWPGVLEAMGSTPTNKYAEGYPGKRYYGGCEVVDEIEQLAIDRVKALFGAEHANVQAHAGAMTNTAVYLACLQPGDTILSLSLAHGGHLSHGLKVNISGKLYNIVSYGVSRDDFLIDFDQVRALALEHRPKLIICGGSAYPRIIEADKFREIADEVGALLLCDMAHFAGLVAAGLAPEPGAPLRLRHLDHAQDAGRPARRLHPLQGRARPGGRPRHLPRAAGRAAPAHDRGQGDLLQDRRARSPSRPISARFARMPTGSPPSCVAHGLDIITGGTDTHLLLVDLRSTEWTGKDAEDRLHEVGVTVNKNGIPFDERPPTVTSGLRLGSPAVTMRGFDEEDMGEVAAIICGALAKSADLGRAQCALRRPLREASALSGLSRLLLLRVLDRSTVTR